MENLCRFCGLDLVDTKKYLISSSEVIKKFYHLLPREVEYDNIELPKNCCNICNIKICDIIEFYEAVLATNRNLKSMLKGLPSKANEVSPPAKSIRLRRLSELVKYKNDLKGSGKPVTHKSVSVTEIYDKLKAKGSITISKFIDSDDEAVEDNMEDSESDCTYSVPKVNPVNISSDSDFSDTEKPVGPKRKRASVKNPQVISLEDMQPNFVCVRCKSKFKSVEALRHHLETNNECKDNDILCGECKRIFKTRRVYYKHVRDVHEKKETPVFNCTNCDTIFSRECELHNHRVICTGVCNEDYSGILFRCKDCDKSFERRIDLIKHIENHTKQLLCEACGKSCKTKKAYSQHIREHLGLKPYKCTLCDKRFRTNTLLQAHQHVHTGVKSYVCDTCGKPFAKRASLMCHVRLHTGEKPYLCDLCEQRFTTLERLKNHLRKHRQNLYPE